MKPPIELAPKRVLVFATARDYALIGTSIRDDAAVLVWGTSDDRAIGDFRLYLGNPWLFPQGRSRIVSLIGAFPEGVRDALAEGARAHGFAVQVRQDTVALAAERGPATVVWYAESVYQPLAQFWAHRAETLHGTRYVVLSRQEDYAALEARGAIVASAIDFGGGSLVASQGAAHVLGTLEAAQVEVLRIHELTKAVAASGGAEMSGGRQLDEGEHAGLGPPLPPNGSTVDVVFYTGYSSVHSPAQPLDFYDSASVVATYTDAMCGAMYCRPNVVPRTMLFRGHAQFPPCPITFQADQKGYNCPYDALGSEDNHVDLAVRGQAADELLILKTTNSYTIGNVVIFAHWLDIPYREKLYPYTPNYKGYRNYKHPPGAGTGVPYVEDADHQAMDTDNDFPLCTFQNYAIVDRASTACFTGDNTWHDPANLPKDPDTAPNPAEDAYEGDVGGLDWYLADFEQRAGEPYATAHAGFGRLAAHTNLQVGLLVTTANAVLNGTTAPPGATLVYGGTGASSAGAYDPAVAFLECRYGDGSPLIKAPCVAALGGTEVCANEIPFPTPPVLTYTEDDFYTSAASWGQIAVSDSHSTNPLYTDYQSNQFQGDGDPVIVSSRGIAAFSGGSFPPGFWQIYGSNTFGYAFLNPDPTICEGTECWLEPNDLCVPGCMATRQPESSFVSSLVARGVAGIRGSIAGHAPYDGLIVTGHTPVSFLRELASGVEVGKAHRIAINERRFRWSEEAQVTDPDPVFEIGTLLIGDPLLKLPAIAPGCANAPAIVVGKGASAIEPQGTPWVRGVRKDGVVMQGVLDFQPVLPVSPGAARFTHGNPVAAGNFVVAGTDSVDEIADGKGPMPCTPGVPCTVGADSLVKVHDHTGKLLASFYAFPGQTDYGVTLASGNVRNAVGAWDIVAGKGPKDVFAPELRVFSSTFSSWTPNTSLYAYPGLGYGVNVGAGDVAGDDLDEVLTGPGPGPTHLSEVRAWNGVPALPVEHLGHRFPAFGTLVSYGVNVGAADLDGDGKSEVLAGKGPGTGTYLGSGLMDNEVRAFKRSVTAWDLKLTIDDPFGLDLYAFLNDGLQMGARAAGYEGDGTPHDEVLVAQGPVSTSSTTAFPPLERPPSYRGSRIKGFDVDATVAPWTSNEILDTVPYDEQEYPPGTAIAGATIARMTSVGIANPYSARAGEEAPPVRPDTNGKELARQWAGVLAGAAEELFLDATAKAGFLAALEEVARSLERNDTTDAAGRIVELLLDANVKVVNLWTRQDVIEMLEILEASVAQQITNSPPVAVIERSHDYAALSGAMVRVPLNASLSEDRDSTPGTRDNIRHYRWYDDRTGIRVGHGEIVAVELYHDGSAETNTFSFTLELEDSYGARSYATTTVNLVPKR